jgi:acetyl-CoA carboxylase biotin carboxylase subunit
MFKKILIANRGEIALRVIRACHEMGIKTVAIHSEADAGSLHVRFADESVCVGPAEGSASYRNIPNILSAAEVTRAEAIHPGYGFLAENSHFAEVCESAGIKFIGPRPEAIALMGNKANARERMMKEGVPVIPGSGGRISDPREALEIGQKIGYPLLIKAISGGGGRGMRVVRKEEEMAPALQSAQSEAKGAFGDDGVYIEKYFTNTRHIEVQVLADEHGNKVHLGERDCSIQRRHQKLIEESPSPAVDDTLRKELGRAALNAVSASSYTNAGTVEFLMDADRRFYFIEMNTRIQVEHPITEMISGIDLVRAQIQIAAGLPLPFKQSQIKLRGHSIECRINAECPDTWVPSPGVVTACYFPGGPGVRVDSILHAGQTVTPHYDSLLAKLIVHAPTRGEAIAKMRMALSECVIEGIKTTLPFHRRTFEEAAFIKGQYATDYLAS